MRFIFFVSAFLFPGVLIGQTGTFVHGEDRAVYERYFVQAAEEFNIPADILRGVAFTQTRWSHLRWAPDDTASSCSGIPRVYGVMGLWNNAIFGFQLTNAAAALGTTIEQLKEDPLQNIRGAAVLLDGLYRRHFGNSSEGREVLENWFGPLTDLSGIPQKDLALQLSYKTFQFLSEGYSSYGIRLPKREIRLERMLPDLIAARSESERVRKQQNDQAVSTPDYPPAIWRPGKANYYYTSGSPKQFVVVHDMESTYEAVVAYFQTLSDGRTVSIHYCINGRPDPSSTAYSNAPAGEITQMVEERFWAWHAVCWNQYMFGIEHEGYVSNPAWFTPQMYQASSQLVSYLCDKYNIPKDRFHIIGHDEKRTTAWVNWVNSSGIGFSPTCNTHTDPGQYWDWTNYMKLITTSDTIVPQIVSVTPVSNKPLQTYREVSLSFNTAMDPVSTKNAFSIIPSITGTLSMSADYRSITFKPSANFNFQTNYTITIDTTAKNISLKRKFGPVPYSLSFWTVPVDTFPPKITDAYPYHNATDVPVRPEVWLKLSDAVITTSLSKTLKFVDDANISVAMNSAKNEIIDDISIVSFFPVLKPNRQYTITLLPGSKDLYNNISNDTTILRFTTEKTTVSAQGILIDQMENNTFGWDTASIASASVGIDTTHTKFSFSSAKKISGAGSGLLTYAFLQKNGGVIEVPVKALPVIDSYGSVGLWVYGDKSFHRLKLRFSPNNDLFDLGVLHWRGWKYLSLNTSALTGSNKRIISLILRQENDSVAQGEIYIDDLQHDAVTTEVKEVKKNVPEIYGLSQNYPNPFNPSTSLMFSIPERDFVRLAIFDVLGREVAVPVNEIRPAGVSTVHFDASRLSSGMYFFTLRSGAFTQTRKMILAK